MKRLICALVMMATSAHAGTQTSVTNCAGDLLDLQAIGFSADVIDDRAMTIQATNVGAAQIVAAYVEWELWSDARPAPLDAGYFRDATAIDAGLLPGEVIQVVDYHFMEGLSLDAARGAVTLTLKLDVRSVTTSAGDRRTCP